MLKWQVGDVTITRVLESETPFMRGGGPESAVPDAFPEAVREIGWLQPHFADETGKMRFSIHALLVDAPGLKLVVDTCVGNDKPRNVPFWNMLQTGFLAEFEKTGWTREDVNAVVCTHMHVDHVGWNTMLVDGNWVPTFPKARYLLGTDEWKHWSAEAEGEQRQILDDSIQPLFDARLVDLVPSDHRLSDEVRLVPTPGHTPGHVSVEIASKGRLALITGDLMHHPCQIARPDWSSNFDTDQNWSRRTRHEFLSDVAARDALVIGTHFATPTAGHVVRDGESYRLEVGT
jgi:glyoxylase-like metal-dependent hydrolase (beta-lactamase superfamily II)